MNKEYRSKFDKQAEMSIRSIPELKIKRAVSLEEETAAAKLLDSYGLKPFTFLDVWERSHSTLYKAFEYNLSAVQRLEKEQPGICAILNKRFKIWNFGRYKPEVLLKQYREMDDLRLPYGVLVTSLSDVSEENPKYSDGYFHKDWLKCIKDFSEELGTDYALRIGECENVMDLARFMQMLKTTYSKDRQANFGIFTGHGNSSQFFLGNKENQINYLTKVDLADSRFQKYRQVFSPHAKLVIDACDTGQDGAFAEELSAEFNAQVIAPMSRTSLKRIKVHVKTPRFIILDVEYHFGAMVKVSGG
jgi:hypothetical protein